MSQMTKREVNTIVTGLSIALSIVVMKGLNSFVATLRWWILSRHHHSLWKVDLILQAESVTRVIRLAARTSRWSVHASASIWLSAILAVQIALALLGLCYSIDIHDSMTFVNQKGKVSVPAMSNIQTIKIIQREVDSFEAQEYTANSYGQISLAFDTALPEKIPGPGSIWTASDPLMFCDVQRCTYVFHETTAEPTEDTDGNDKNADGSSEQEKPLVVASDRTLDSSAVCQSWSVTSGGNGTTNRITIDTKGDGMADEVFIPVLGGVNQTTFIADTVESCGSGCRTIAAFEAADTNSWYYRCNVTVDRVKNSTRLEHEVSGTLRSMAAAAIALQGIGVSSLDLDDVQYQIYPAESVFGLPNLGSNDSMALTMARFAIGTIAITAQSNDPLVIDGFAPMKGSHLVVDKWGYVILILASVASAQLLLAIATAVIASRIVIPEGPIAVAQVLSPIADKLQKVGSLASGGHGGSWIYKAVQTSDEGIYDLFMEELDCT
ncbi:hypothetical protein BKA61DRAFT_466718 [Leptodontidium sp. MPI-SDFR-AT-0119]|nr:hypothetical protein BKA61DRAFT_466718 [Leptodontidium sp. MPI-SDFR-AT-0119]